jgi:nucleoside-diphosphate kinase
VAAASWILAAGPAALHFFILVFFIEKRGLTRMQKARHMTETTLVLLKPDCIAKRLCGTVIGRFEEAGLEIVGCKMMLLEDRVLAVHYAHVSDKPFYPDLKSFMKSSPVIVLALSGEDAVARLRDLLGPTDSRKAPKGTIRGDFGDSVMMNIAHGSDSPENAVQELKRFFNENELFETSLKA